jgi:hypothetical protein
MDDPTMSTLRPLRSNSFLWYMRIVQAVAATIVLAITGSNASNWHSWKCSLPSRLSYNIVCVCHARFRSFSQTNLPCHRHPLPYQSSSISSRPLVQRPRHISFPGADGLSSQSMAFSSLSGWQPPSHLPTTAQTSAMPVSLSTKAMATVSGPASSSARALSMVIFTTNLREL